MFHSFSIDKTSTERLISIVKAINLLKNNEVDGILEAYRLEFNPDKRIVMYHRLQAILHEEQPYTFLWKSRNAIAYSRRYRGVSWYPGGDRSSLAENSLNWWVSKESQRY